jgi:hypothetical protein
MAKGARCMALFFLLLGAAAPAVLAVADGKHLSFEIFLFPLK